MRVGQRRWSSGSWGETHGAWSTTAQILLVFGAREALETCDVLAYAKAAAPNAHVMACSTAGEIFGTEVSDGTITATAVELEHSTIRTASVDLSAHGSSRDAGAALARAVVAEDLAHVFVLSDGLKVNGSELVRGMSDALPAGIAITGGLSGDAARFQRTLVALDSAPTEGRIAAIGLCGDRLRVGYGSMGGWDAFGPERLVSRSKGNVLYELDGKPALDLYMSYLGEHAKDLPASGLLFPLCMRFGDGTDGVVRTILSVDREAGTMTFAGDMPEGAYARLMKANFDRLIDGATGAASRCTSSLRGTDCELAILISCVGRKLVLKQRVEEEVEAVREVLGPHAILTGFYSYGEVSPFTPSAKCELHNQTMTITTIGEV